VPGALSRLRGYVSRHPRPNRMCTFPRVRLSTRWLPLTFRVVLVNSSLL
jgi:hypothetical protein